MNMYTDGITFSKTITGLTNPGIPGLIITNSINPGSNTSLAKFNKKLYTGESTSMDIGTHLVAINVPLTTSGITNTGCVSFNWIATLYPKLSKLGYTRKCERII